MAGKRKLCGCGLPLLFDSFRHNGVSVSGYVCIGSECPQAWTLQHSEQAVLSG